MLNKIFLLVIIISAVSLAQPVFVPVEHDVYDFLNRMKIKSAANYNDAVIPFTRKEVSNILIQVNKNKLTMVEKKYLDWMEEEFSSEIVDKFGRNYLYSYKDSVFTLTFSPLAGAEFRNYGGITSYKRWWGVYAYAYYSDWFGASINFRDQGEFGDAVDTNKSFSPARGHEYVSAPEGIEYSDVRGSINFSWGWGNVSLAKDYVRWGSGYFGKPILSDNAPSFPFIRFQLQPVDWFKFSYIHAWLHTDVLDSSSFYYANPNSELYPLLRERFQNKYLAVNIFTLMPKDWLQVSFGNSVVYSGDLRPEFFVPFMFFKYLDRDTGKASIEDGNGQMFADVKVNYFKGIEFYTSLFLDVAEIRNILDGDFWNTWYAATFGTKTADVIIDNLSLTIEYTRVNPWVYEHKDQTTTYQHLDYVMGHWLGQNADQFRIQAEYRPLSRLKLKLWYERLRKGGLKDIYYAYKDRKQEEFLYSPVRKDNVFGLRGEYELFHDLNVHCEFKYSDISDEVDGRTPSFLIGEKSSFVIGGSYGL